MPNTGFGRRENLLIWVGGDIPPNDKEWTAYTQALGALADQARQTKKPFFVLVFADAGAPSAAQREQAVKAGAGPPSRTALISTSAVARGVITVFSWFNLSMKSFAPKEIEKALAFLDIPSTEIGPVWSEVRRVESSLAVRVRAVYASEPYLSTTRIGRANP
jgi:hypothetical protein